jgi:sugar phosphate isomerase/epimerase
MIGTTKVFLSSYSCKWSLGFAKWKPDTPRSLEWFIDLAADHGLDGVQVADNVNPELLCDERIRAVTEHAEKRRLEIEWGFQDWTDRKARRMIEICRLSGARILRAVLGRDFGRNERENGGPAERAFKEIAGLLPDLENSGVVLALENHFDLRIKDILQLLDRIQSPFFGVCLDTSNAIGEIMHPIDCIRLLARRSPCLHLKDYRIEKIVGGYRILGCAVGAGDQDTRAVLREALRINPDMEICIELGTAFPDSMDRVFDIEAQDVETSIRRTLGLLEEYYTGLKNGGISA